MMERTQVVSSNIVSLGYDPAAQTLEVEFKGSLQNKVWQYTPVSQDVYDEIRNSDSIGRAFSVLVKTNPDIAGTDVTQPAETDAF